MKFGFGGGKMSDREGSYWRNVAAVGFEEERNGVLVNGRLRVERTLLLQCATYRCLNCTFKIRC